MLEDAQFVSQFCLRFDVLVLTKIFLVIYSYFNIQYNIRKVINYRSIKS